MRTIMTHTPGFAERYSEFPKKPAPAFRDSLCGALRT